jgi:hypothetical protein
MRSLSLSLLIALSTLTGCFVAAHPAENHAARNGYVYLGDRWVRGGGQAVHEAIGGLRNDGRFRSMMLVIEHAPVEVYDLVVTFGDNQTFRPGTRLTFGPDSTTREIDLPGGERIIRRVDFVVANLPGDGRAKLELWAR